MSLHLPITVESLILRLVVLVLTRSTLNCVTIPVKGVYDVMGGQRSERIVDHLKVLGVRRVIAIFVVTIFGTVATVVFLIRLKNKDKLPVVWHGTVGTAKVDAPHDGKSSVWMDKGEMKERKTLRIKRCMLHTPIHTGRQHLEEVGNLWLRLEVSFPSPFLARFLSSTNLGSISPQSSRPSQWVELSWF